ncbi:MAG: hypothetical protein LC797_13225 [Chloroflexi bacterium]|nr:hypothetical protein [Chloroflexota bacterium]
MTILKISRLVRVLGLIALGALLFTPGTALAHERRTVANGKYDETFDTADGKFNKVEPQTALQFPVALPEPMPSAAAVQAAQAEAASARTLAYGGVAVGVLGLSAGVTAWLTRPRAVLVLTTPSARPASERI